RCRHHRRRRQRPARMRRAPIVVAALATVLLGAISASGQTTTPPPNPCGDPLQELRCPDLVMSAPFDLTIDRHSDPGHVLLRASSSSNNHGAGPLEPREHSNDTRSTTDNQIAHRVNGTSTIIPMQALHG